MCGRKCAWKNFQKLGEALHCFKHVNYYGHATRKRHVISIYLSIHLLAVRAHTHTHRHGLGEKNSGVKKREGRRKAHCSDSSPTMVVSGGAELSPTRTSGIYLFLAWQNIAWQLAMHAGHFGLALLPP